MREIQGDANPFPAGVLVHEHARVLTAKVEYSSEAGMQGALRQIHARLQVLVGQGWENQGIVVVD